MIYKKAYKIVILFNNKIGLILIFKILKIQKIAKHYNLIYYMLLYAHLLKIQRKTLNLNKIGVIVITDSLSPQD